MTGKRPSSRARTRIPAGSRAMAPLEDLLETAPIAAHRLGPDGTILWANAEALRMLGWARDDYVGRDIRELHADPDVPTREKRGSHHREGISPYPKSRPLTARR